MAASLQSIYLKKLLLVVFILTVNLFSAQKINIDSLVEITLKLKADTSKLKNYKDICNYYQDADAKKAIEFGHQGLELAQKLNEQAYIADFNIKLGNAYRNQSDFKNAYLYCERAIELNRKLGNKPGLINSLNILSTSYKSAGDLSNALHYMLDALKEAEPYTKDNSTAGEKELLGILYSNIGNLYANTQDLDKAMAYHFRSVAVFESIRSDDKLSKAYINLGGMFTEKEPDKAMAYFEKAGAISKRTNNPVALAAIYANIGSLYYSKEMWDKVLEFDLKALEAYEKAGLVEEQALCMNNIAGDYLKLRAFSKAAGYAKKSLELAEKHNLGDDVANSYHTLSQIYKMEGNFEEAYRYYTKYDAQKDSLMNGEKEKAIIEMSTKYETEKKEAQNKSLLLQNELSDRTIRQQKITSYFVIGGLVLAVSLAFFIFRGLKQQRRANTIITQQKQEVEEHRKDILDSIHYAKRIQDTLLAGEELLKTNLSDHFILFNPKDIVSGDFYWATSVQRSETGVRREESSSAPRTTNSELFFLAVCDSTGHGVPGAFMSLLNINLLNEAINEKHIYDPAKVFDHVRKRLVSSVSKDGQKDGFDGILLCIDKKNNSVSYVAANNSPLKIANNNTENLPYDKMPVGFGEKTEPFTTHTITVEPGSTLYLYTDGYADQFGGPKGKKFKYKPLEDLILSNSNLPMEKQQQILSSNFKEWKAALEQVDDVLVIGLQP